MSDVNLHFLEFEKNSGFYFSRVLNSTFVSPETLQISITHRCPLRCRMCSIAKNPSKIEEEMSTKEVKSLIEQAAQIGISELYLTGGEPFVRDDFIEIVNYAEAKGLITSVNTSGILINNDVAEKIADSSLSYITFSIDGLEKIHDYIRGKGVFSNAINAIREINRIKSEKGNEKLHISLVSVIMNQNLDEVIPLIHFVENLGVTGIRFQPVLVDNTKMFRQNNKSSLWIPKSRLKRLSQVLSEMEKCKKRSKIDIIFDAKMISQYFRGEFEANKCFVGYNRLFVGLWGNVGLVCPVDSRNFSNIENFREKSLSEIWDSDKAKEARVAVKNCRQECVQGCALMPHAENLWNMYLSEIRNFIRYIESGSEIAEYMTLIRNNLEKYEKILLLHKSDENLRIKMHTDLKEIEYVLSTINKIKQDIEKRIGNKKAAQPLEEKESAYTELISEKSSPNYSPEKAFSLFLLNARFYFSKIINRALVGPHWVYLSVTNRCLLDCRMCGVKKLGACDEMSTDELKKIIKEISEFGGDQTILFTGGEPFLRKDIFELIEYSSSLGMPTEIVSNGQLIDEELTDKIVKSGLRNIAISLDGATAEAYESIRGIPGSFEKAKRAIRLLSEARKKIGKGPQISAWTTMMRQNITELSEIMRLSKNLGADVIVYHPVIINQTDMQRTKTHGPLWPNEEDLKIFKEEMDRITEYRKKNGFVAFLHDPSLFLRYFNGENLHDAWQCNPFEFLNIGPDGNMQICGDTFGNAKSGVKKVWESKAAGKSRALMKKCTKSCLQTCWARPDSESLKQITAKFAYEINRSRISSSIKRDFILKALEEINAFESTLKHFDGISEEESEK
ncbi:MAG: radical SAM protein [Candidatus Woesearchaeota archaeon]|nr:radical SAM protein [Candidatus Woesearchaeota archaeon]